MARPLTELQKAQFFAFKDSSGPYHGRLPSLRTDGSRSYTSRTTARQEQPHVKVRASVRRICENCKLIRREGVLRVICTNPKHKQRQG